MHISASAEVFRLAYPALDKGRKLVIPHLNDAFKASSLAEFEVEIRYVPIVMPEGMRERYPARSKLRLKERLYDCAPHLNYEVFVSGTESMQLKEYLSGIASSAPHLARLGVSAEQIEAFRKILKDATALSNL
jgi:hypothetical protein